MAAFTVRADYQSTVLGDTPLAYYPLSVTVDPSGTTATDLSGNGNYGTYNGSSPEFNTVPGPSAFIPNALQFDGASCYVDLSPGPNTSILNFSGPITLEAWAEPANSTSFGDILAKGYDSSSGQEIMLRVNGPYGANFVASSGTSGVSGGQQSTNWVHVVLVNDGATTSLYLNGSLVQSTSDTTGSATFSDSWAIGNGTSSGFGRFFNGNICQVALYNYGLSPSAIVKHYAMGKFGVLPASAAPVITNQPVAQIGFTNGTATFSVGLFSIYPVTNQWYKNGSPLTGQTNTVLTLSNLQGSDIASYTVTSGNINGSTNSAAANLTLPTISAYDRAVAGDGALAYYPLDSSIDTGLIAADLSGNGNYGKYQSLNPVANTVAGPSAYIPNAVSFNGSSTFVDLNVGKSSTQLNFSGPIALEAWVQPADSTSFGDIVAKGYDANSYAEVTMRVNGPYGANYYGSSGSTSLSGGQQNTSWTHLVLSSDGTRCNFYINGVVVQSAPDTSGSQIFADGWAIGNGTSAGCTRFFNGNICQVAIYNHGLTTNQVLQHFFLGSFGIAPSNSIPIISAQPQPQSAFAGGTATFSYSVIGTLPTTNLWFKNGSPLTGQTNRTLVLNNVQSGDAANYSVVIGNSIGKTNSASASLTVLASGNSLVWTITNNTGVWDSGVSANWVNVSNSQQVVFNTGDKVLFDDTPGVPTAVMINGPVAPSTITVDSDNNAYNISSSSSTITGASALIKKGTSTLTLVSPGGFSGPVTVAGGSIYAGNNSFSSVASITISNTGSVDFGGGTYNTGQPITVVGAGLTGQGALFNSYADYPLEVFNVNMTGDTMFGGSARWDMGGGSSITGAHTLTIDWSAGATYGEWNSVTIGTNVAGISLINNSKLGLKYMDTSFLNPSTVMDVGYGGQAILWNGGYNGSFHIENAAQLVIYSDGALSGSSIVFEDGTEWDDYGGGSADEPISSAITFNGLTHIVMGNHNMVFTNVISGAGGFYSDAYDHALVFSASNTYAGPTIIGTQLALTGNGSISHSPLIFLGYGDSTANRLDVSGRTDHTLTLANGQTLGGVGAVNGGLTVAPGAILAPAGTNYTSSRATGTISVSSNIVLNGTTVIKLNGSGVNDVVQAAGSITYGGTLNLANITNDLVAGDTFQIFNAGSRTGSFASITPSTPAAGLFWDLSHLSSGQVSVTSTLQPVIGSTRVVAGKLVFSGTGGTISGTFYVYGTTNLSTGPWTVVSTNQFDSSGNFNVTNTISSGPGQKFYRLQE